MSQIIGKRAKNEVQQCDNFKPFFQEAGSAYSKKCSDFVLQETTSTFAATVLKLLLLTTPHSLNCACLKNVDQVTKAQLVKIYSIKINKGSSLNHVANFLGNFLNQFYP